MNAKIVTETAIVFSPNGVLKNQNPRATMMYIATIIAIHATSITNPFGARAFCPYCLR